MRSSMAKQSGSLFGAILLVAGTAIGGGMLALPVLTSLGGFIPSLVIFCLCWLFMACTGLLFLEVCQWTKKGSNVISMAEKTLGPFGKAVAWGVYLFLFYCLTLAYIVGCGNLVSQTFQIPDWAGPLLFVLVFSPIVFAGAKFTGKINILCMLSLAILYCVFVFLGYSYVKSELLIERNWPLSLMALPVAFASFGYQGIIPTLYEYLSYNLKKTRIAIIVGSSIPLVTYIVWQWLILGVVPTYGPGGLVEALEKGDNAVQPLKNFIGNPQIYIVGQYFAFFALATSFFGVTLGLIDFLADGFRVKKTIKERFLISFLVFMPPLILAILHPHVFLIALEYAGGFGAALLLGLIPILMVWSGRYRLNLSSEQLLPGGKPVLLLLMAFVVFEICFELFNVMRSL
jgi:tyrosine-specific transport protein